MATGAYRLTDIEIYGDFGDNPALNEVAVGPRLRELVNQYGYQVRTVWDGIARVKSGYNVASADVHTYIGGYDKKRWVTEMTAHTDYAAADELGRKADPAYEGSNAMQTALYTVLPTRI
jgi:hypothetical protein